MSVEHPISDCTVAAHGRLDASTVEAFGEDLQAAVDHASIGVTVDLAAVTYVSSSAMRVLLLAHRAAIAKGCCLYLESVAPRVKRVMSLAGFDRVFSFLDSMAGDAPS